jgi:hypothetical protein
MQKDSLSIMDFAQKIQDNIGRKKDYIVPTSDIIVEPDFVVVPQIGGFTPTDHFHRQIAGLTDIPWKYYQKVMQNNPELLTDNVANWMDQKPANSKRMFRTFNGDDQVARACLSDRYRRIDDEQIFEAVVPPLMEIKDTQVISSQVTDKKLYLMLAFANREAEIKKGDVVQAGIIITNSEIGMSRFTVQPYVHRLWCLNGAVANVAGKDYGLKQIHAGRRIDAADNYIAYKDETLAADDQALKLKMRDTVTSIATGTMWDEIVSGLKQAAVSEEIKQPVPAVEELAKTIKLNDTEKNSVLTNLIKNGDLTRWGAGNAVTQVANEIDDYDRATELQDIGGKVFGMSEREWHGIAEKAA